MIIYKKTSGPYTVFVHGPDVMAADSGELYATLHHRAGGQIHHSQWTESEKDLVFEALTEAQTPAIRQAWQERHNLPTPSAADDMLPGER